MYLNFKNDLETNFTIFLRRKTKNYWYRGVCLRIISPIDQLAVNTKKIHLSSIIPKSPWECLLANPSSTCGEDQTSTLCLLQSLTNETMGHYRLSHSSVKAQCYRHLAAKSLAVWTLRLNPDSHSVSLNNQFLPVEIHLPLAEEERCVGGRMSDSASWILDTAQQQLEEDALTGKRYLC